MGYVYAISPCICCKRTFPYNPKSVPSCSAVTGQREPICKSCFGRLNERRKAAGLEPFVALADAYEPLDEYELFDDE